MEAEGIKKEIGEHDERKKLEHLDLKSEVFDYNSFHNFDMIVLMISSYHYLHNQIKYHVEDFKIQVGIELVPLMKQSQAGRPRKDPSTGYMLSHSLSTTDVTKAQVPGNVHRY